MLRPLDAFAESLHTRGRSEATIRHYLSDLRQFTAWFEQRTGKAFSPEAVAEHDLRAWRDHLAGVLKPASINRKLASLRAFFHFCVEEGWVEKDPARRIPGVARTPDAPRVLGRHALKRILDRAHEEGRRRDSALLELLAATGLRVSEAASLRVGDLELSGRSGWVLVRQDKGCRRRRVPLHARARRSLREYLEERGFPPEEPLPRPPDPRAREPLFLSQRGGAMTPFAVWYTVKKYARRAGMKGVSPHTLRRTVAARLIGDPQVDLATASAFLGNSRLDIPTGGSRPAEEDLARAAERLE